MTTDVKLYDGEEDTPFQLATADLTIPASASTSAGCTDNDDCEWTNIAGVRYVLNTLFNIKYQITSREYARSAPIVSHPYLYQGSFEYPSYFGHFRKYLVTEANAESAEWDTADAGHITNANTNNSDGRKLYTAELSGGDWSKINFDVGNLSHLNNFLIVTPEDGDNDDEEKVITRVRGKKWDYDNSQWVERANKLGGIMHSAPAIVDHNSRTGSRDEVAYVGDLYGMLSGHLSRATCCGSSKTTAPIPTRPRTLPLWTAPLRSRTSSMTMTATRVLLTSGAPSWFALRAGGAIIFLPLMLPTPTTGRCSGKLRLIPFCTIPVLEASPLEPRYSVKPGKRPLRW
jgi:hypothetical protein